MAPMRSSTSAGRGDGGAQSRWREGLRTHEGYGGLLYGQPFVRLAFARVSVIEHAPPSHDPPAEMVMALFPFENVTMDVCEAPPGPASLATVVSVNESPLSTYLKFESHAEAPPCCSKIPAVPSALKK